MLHDASIESQEDLFDALVTLVTTWSSPRTQRFVADSVGVDLAVSDTQVLYTIGRFAGARPADVADELGITRPTMSKAITRLEEQGLIERRVGETDRRSVSLMLTSSGADVYARLVAFGAEATERAFAGLDPAEMRTTTNALRRLITSFHTPSLGG